MSDVRELEPVRRKRQREALDAKDRWTPREALAALLADIDAGVEDVDAVVVVTIKPFGAGVKVGRYVGAVGPRRTLSGLELIGACYKAITDWARGD